MRAITVSLGPAAAPGTASAPIRLDEWSDAPVAVQVAIASGAVNFTVQHSFDDPNALITPIAQGSMFWDTGLVPAAAIGGAAGTTFAIPTAPLWIRLLLNSGSGAVRMTVTQYQVVNE
jgi:hypothetical protein